MTTYILIPGAGGAAWYWHRLVPQLRQRGHEAIAVDLPAGDDSAGLQEYADTVVDAAGQRKDLVVVAQSMGGLTAPLVCSRLPVSRLVLVNAMIPAPGETGHDWWNNTGQDQARRECDLREGRSPDGPFDPLVYFFHDVPEDITKQAMTGEPPQSGTPFEQPWPLDVWPDVPTEVLSSREDRLFPVEFQIRTAQHRLGVTPKTLPGGHLAALSQPEALAAGLDR
ncbi:alpha/beta hydrolase [Micromonospora sp. DR5-3]|uniref:alpha/beta fold hydrolase n=1 Tax=unclassified Micromonospora TaxID=2617518 RepID=UPI0011D6509C|nr:MULTISPECIES: alpha/beta fold hydrolase [unclassified Micromonospora]MCW3819423.1 alpha/beta hydrolase [Micromonospora sp. DR5-3]TYC20792.1 alpha/beta hydrolase [Micromonospora sp. MP36]